MHVMRTFCFIMSYMTYLMLTHFNNIRDRLIEFEKKNFFLPPRVSGTLKAGEYAGKNRFS